MTDLGGITYGQAVPNSPHGVVIGAAPMPNPAYTGKDPSVAKFMFTPVGKAKGWKKNNTGGSFADIPSSADAKQKNAWFNLRYVYGVMWSADGAGNEGEAGATAMQ